MTIEFIQECADALQPQLKLCVLRNLFANLCFKTFLHVTGGPLVRPLLIQRRITLRNQLCFKLLLLPQELLHEVAPHLMVLI